MADKVKKTLYHSELVTLGTVNVLIKSDVTPSKYKGKPPYVSIILDGNERQYWTENQQCEDALRGLSGRKVMLEASGSRDDAAIKVLGSSARENDGRGQVGRDVDRGGDNRSDDRSQRRDAGSQEHDRNEGRRDNRPLERERQQSDRTPQTAPERPQGASQGSQAGRPDIVGAKHKIMQLTNLRLLCTDAAHFYFDEYRKRRRSAGAPEKEDMVTDGMFENAVAGLCMGAEKLGLQNMMPTTPLPLPNKPAAPPESKH